MKLTVAAVQLNPIIGHVKDNCKRAMRMLDSALNANRSPDLIILPELALTGYNFKDRKHIAPYLEIKGRGTSFEFGKQLSLKYHCHTLLGYPEKVLTTNDFKIYNSAAMISPAGSLIFNYRKSFLYETDEQWGCEESPDGFQTFDLTIKEHTFKTAIGICMDLNPYKFTAPFDKYEFANFCYDKDVDLILLPTAWLNSSWSEDWKDDDIQKYAKYYGNQLAPEINNKNENNDVMLDSDASEFDRENPDGRTARYWIMRMNPLYTKPHIGKKKLVVVCNRSGMEGKMMYGGSSSIIRFNGGPSHKSTWSQQLYIDFDLFGTMGQGTEGVLVRDVDV